MLNLFFVQYTIHYFYSPYYIKDKHKYQRSINRLTNQYTHFAQLMLLLFSRNVFGFL